MTKRILLGAWLAMTGCGEGEGEDDSGAESEAESEGEGGDEGEAEAESESESESEASFTTAVILLASSDAASGAISTIDVETLAAEKLVGPAGGDAVGRAWFGSYYVVNRMGFDSVQVHDPKKGFALTKEFSVGSTTDNAQDICCAAADRCFVPRLHSADILVVDPTAEDEEIGTIDLSKVADDGVPNAHTCVIAGTTLLVELQNLDDADPYLTALEPGWIAALDASGEDATPSLYETAVHNPFSRFALEPDGASAIIAEIGGWGALDGGYERIGLPGGSPQGIVIGEKALGGDAGTLAVCSTGEAFAIATLCDAEFNCSTPLLPVDLDSGEVGAAIYDPGSFALTWAAGDDRGRLWVAERNYDGPSGIRVYGCDGSEITEGPIDVGMPPAFEGVIEFL